MEINQHTTNQKNPLPSGEDIDLEKRFRYHAPTPTKVLQHEFFREECKRLAYFIKATIPAGREQAIALTHLEDVMMWGNAGIARN